MSKVYELKVFKNGGSNAVRIPAAIPIAGDRLYLVVDNDSAMRLERSDPEPMRDFFDYIASHPWGDEPDGWESIRQPESPRLRESMLD